MREVRGDDIAMIFQEPMTSLNPVFTVGDQIAEAVILHQGCRRRRPGTRRSSRSGWSGINDPERRVKQYPHEMSGGMRQRVMIAMALSCDPKLLIADEPTTALDVTIQAQILELIRELQDRTGTALLLITHDLGGGRRDGRGHRRDVRRPGRRDGQRRRGPARPEAPLHARACSTRSPSKGKRGERLNVDPGHRAQPVPHAARAATSRRAARTPSSPAAGYDPRIERRPIRPTSPAGCTRRRPDRRRRPGQAPSRPRSRRCR